jgi:hypothetical protein
MVLTAPLAWIRALSRGSIQRLSIKSKLILMLLLASGFSTLVTATLQGSLEVTQLPVPEVVLASRARPVTP